jgi:PKD repeat protein
MRVYLDSTPLYTANVAVITPGYAPVTVTVPSAFADSQPHVLRFASQTAGSGNIHVDDVMLDVAGGAPFTCQPNSIPWVTSVPTNGVTAGDSTSPVVVTLDSTGYASGIYTGSLCVNTSDPVKPTIIVPMTMTVQNPPACSFTSSSPDDLGETTVFTNNTTGDAPLVYRWDLGDGSPTSAATHPTHLYGQVGFYTVVLTATNSHGQDVCTSTVSIESKPIPSFTTNSPVIRGMPVVFTNPTLSNPPVLTWAWNLGDGSISTAQTPPPHTYAVGTYTVTLTAVNSKGTSVYTDTVAVYVPQYYIYLPLVTK